MNRTLAEVAVTSLGFDARQCEGPTSTPDEDAVGSLAAADDAAAAAASILALFFGVLLAITRA